VFSIHLTHEFVVLALPHHPGRSPRRAIRAVSTPESRASSTSVIIGPSDAQEKDHRPQRVWWSTKIWRRCAMGIMIPHFVPLPLEIVSCHDHQTTYCSGIFGKRNMLGLNKIIIPNIWGAKRGMMMKGLHRVPIPEMGGLYSYPRGFSTSMGSSISQR